MKQKEKIAQLPKEVIADRAEKLNPNNELYWKARKFSERPGDWAQRIEAIKKSESK